MTSDHDFQRLRGVSRQRRCTRCGLFETDLSKATSCPPPPNYLLDAYRPGPPPASTFHPWEDPRCGGCVIALRLRLSGGSPRAGCADHER